MNASTIRKLVLAVGLAAAMVGPLAGTARADDDRWRGEHNERMDRGRMDRDRMERERMERERWEREHHYAPPPVVYAPPPREVYVAPPVVYAPPSPGISIVLPAINFR